MYPSCETPRQNDRLYRWLKQNGLDAPTLAHLKRIRKTGAVSTVLLAPVNAWPTAPVLPPDLALGEPYIVDVPRGAALTQISLKLKSAFWPTIYAPRKKGELEPWTRAKVRWAWEAVKTVLQEAQKVKNVDGEVSFEASPRYQSLNDCTAAHRRLCAGPLRRRNQTSCTVGSILHLSRYASINETSVTTCRFEHSTADSRLSCFHQYCIGDDASTHAASGCTNYTICCRRRQSGNRLFETKWVPLPVDRPNTFYFA